MSELWIVRRPLETLRSLPSGLHSGGPDSSIDVEAMTAYIRYSGCQIALPTLIDTGREEELLDGSRLISSLLSAEWDKPVACLLKRAAGPPGPDAVPFTPERAGTAGTDAVLVSFARALTIQEARTWRERWLHEPESLDSQHFGWGSLKEGFRGDWIAFVRYLEAMGSEPEIVALNGRYAPWVPGHRRV